MLNFAQTQLKLYIENFDKEKFDNFMNNHKGLNEVSSAFRKEYCQFYDTDDFESKYKEYLSQNDIKFDDLDSYKESLLSEKIEFDSNYYNLAMKFIQYLKEKNILIDENQKEVILRNLAGNSEEEYIDYKNHYDSYTKNEIKYKFVVEEQLDKNLSIIGNKEADEADLYLVINNDIAIEASLLSQEDDDILAIGQGDYIEINNNNGTVLLNTDYTLEETLKDGTNFGYYYNTYLSVNEIKKDASNNYYLITKTPFDITDLTDFSKNHLNSQKLQEVEDIIYQRNQTGNFFSINYLKINNNLSIEYLDELTYNNLTKNLDKNTNLKI